MIALALCASLLTGCSGSTAESSGSALATEANVDLTSSGYYQYLGNIDYSTDAAALVWEQVEGERSFCIFIPTPREVRRASRRELRISRRLWSDRRYSSRSTG